MKNLLLLFAFVLFIFEAHTQIITQSGFTNGSTLLDQNGQEFILEAIPSQFQYEAEIVYESSQSGLTAAAFHAACDGLSNTLLIARSVDGNVLGGYNEGVWSSDGGLQTGLDNNFLFSIGLNEIHKAVTGETHIYNNSSNGPNFGVSGLRFFSDNGSSVIVSNSLGTTYTCPSTSASSCNCRSNSGICASGFTDRFRVDSYEIWQLKSSGTPALAVEVDYNEDGVPESIASCFDQTQRAFPASQILTVSQDALLASWLPEEFLFEASPLFASNNATVGQTNFLNNVAGFTNTIIIISTESGEVIGGFNEGFWSGGNSEQEDLDRNFLFNLNNKRRHDAIPGEVHVITGNVLEFGDGDLTLVFGSDEHYSNFSSYFSTSGSSQNSQDYGSLPEEDAFEIVRIEVWKINDSGDSIFLPVDEDNNGICDHLDIYNFISSGITCPGDFDSNGSITAFDLSSFLSVFGFDCE